MGVHCCRVHLVVNNTIDAVNRWVSFFFWQKGDNKLKENRC
jgi:hypothetical protein